MRNSVVESPDGSIQIAVNHDIPITQPIDVLEAAPVVEYSSDIIIKHHICTITLSHAFICVSLLKFYFMFFRFIDLVDVGWALLSSFAVDSKKNYMIIFILANGAYSLVWAVSSMYMKLYVDAAYQFARLSFISAALSTYDMISVPEQNSQF